MRDFTKGIGAYLAKESEVLSRLNHMALNRAMNAIADAGERGAIVYVCGNGGSAATAGHIANDFNKGINGCTRAGRFHFLCLSDNIPTITAIANDLSYDEIFREQLRQCLTPNDMLLVISGSGNSKNLLAAAEYAREVGATVVGMTGGNGGKLLPLCDYSMHVPIDDQQIIEDLHMMFDHLMMKIFCDRPWEA